ncbi:hypothetical protein Ae201684P_021910 [Aphanomyces euteiches]|uniref:Amino acid permease/ SLC12A domain-containing protein n=1 Tax=Aphanomyces euteiches TaxID=100861 RepID=A0A6G0WT58_9STRA|nr:hypothetical protein Ae201684_012045 [Aphanomyces euteiches]KAH9056173.1 hypothetical protein Ae201684P_021910 [Aphanomyces euteiches]KAH9133118.1 hypothetical protein AeRB84_020730 [Aphanomyces euteiches]
MGLAYLCMVFSIAEVTSVVAFRGCAYGLARWFYCGFTVGCCELLEYTLFVTINTVGVANIMTECRPSLVPYAPWLCCINQVVSAVTFGSAAVDTGGIDSAFVGGFAEFFAVLPLATWMFSGIESLSTLGGNVTDPKRMIPKGQVTVMCTLLATAFCTYMTAICMPPGGINVASVSAIMNGAFSAALNVSEESATVLSFPAVLFSATVFALPASNILVAMAQSKLMPSNLTKSHRRFHSNANALLAIFLVSSALCPLFLYNEDVGLVLYGISMVFGLLAYVAQCAGFIYLRRNHKHMKRLFVSPVGIPGAVYAVVVFCLTLVSL